MLVFAYILFCIAYIAIFWFVAITVAWLINRRELIRLYGQAPYNWRIYGWFFLYIPYLKRLDKHDHSE